ncbi:MAG: hypothetical protein ABSE04_01500 [Candidatus Microgenomates bacterium]|jgi:hypothetical protein
MTENIRRGPENSEPEPGKEATDEAEARKYSSRETMAESLVRGAETPFKLNYGLRRLEAIIENPHITSNLREHYSPPREATTMLDRGMSMEVTIEELQGMGIIGEILDPKSGKADLLDEDYEGMAVHIKRTEKLEGGRYKVNIEYFFGTDEERKELAVAYKTAALELESRDILGANLGIRKSKRFRDNLEELTDILHSDQIPVFRPEHLQTLFNLPSLEELKSGKSIETAHGLGDSIEEALVCNLIMLNSGSKERMLNFLKRPGVQHLISKMAKEEEARRQDVERKGLGGFEPQLPESEIEMRVQNLRYTDEQWKKDNIGDVESWVEDKDRLLEDKDENNPASWRVEKRGNLTKYSNIVAWGGKPGEFGTNKEKWFVENAVGNLSGSVEAAWIAATFLRATGVFACEGYVACRGTNKSLLPLGEGRFYSGDDTGKFLTLLFNRKEGYKNRASGLARMYMRMPDLAGAMWDWAQVVVGVDNSKGWEVEKRLSMIDAWLGTAEQAKRDLVTNRRVEITDPKRFIDGIKGKLRDKKTGKDREAYFEKVKEEPYHRLGDLNFLSLEQDSGGTYTTMQWLGGNRQGPTGVYTEEMRVDDITDEDFTLNNLKKLTKYIGIVFNPIVMTKGSPHLYGNASEVNEALKVIKRNYFENLMYARIFSEAFAKNVMSKTMRLTNPETGNSVEVSSALWAYEQIKEALKDNPATDEDLVKHYLDDPNLLAQIRDTNGVKAMLNEVKGKFHDDVGRVTGKNVF